MNFEGKRNFYDLDTLRAIPVVEVLQRYGVDVKVRYKDGWCRIRSDDNHPSCHINLNKNSWFDHGIQLGGGPIQVVQYFENCSNYDAIQILAEMFDVPAMKNETGETVLTDAQFAQIGIQADMVTKNIDWDFEHFTMEQATKLRDRYKDMSMQQLARTDRRAYVNFIRFKSIPYVYEMKKFYLQAIADLAECKPNTTEYLMVRARAEENEKEYKRIYNILKKAVTKDEVAVAKYNINSVDTDLQNYRDGKLSVECGIVPYIDMKSKAKALNSVLVKLENLSKKDIELLNNEGINYSAFARQGKYNVVVEKSDAERTYIALGKTNALASFRQAQYSNTLGFTEFGVWAKNKMTESGIKESQMAQKLGVANQRLSDALRGKNTNVEEALKKELGYVEPKQVLTEVITPEQLNSQNGKRKFTQLSPEEQDMLITSRYNHPKNRMTEDPNKRYYTKEQLRETYLRNNNKWLYDSELKSERIVPKVSKVGTMDYKEVVATSADVPFYTNKIDAKTAEPIIKIMNENNIPYSSITTRATQQTQFTVRSQEADLFKRVLDKCGLRIEGENHTILPKVTFDKDAILAANNQAQQAVQAQQTAVPTV